MPKIRVVRHAVTQPLDQSYRLIPLTQGQNAIVDAEDFERINQWNWFAQWDGTTESFYAQRHPPRPRRGKSMISMHMTVLECKPPIMIDHRSHDTLDNRKQNLRKCTFVQNGQNRKKSKNNTSGFKGVIWCKDRNRWRSVIKINGCTKHLGHFLSAEEAGRAYDEAAKTHFGEFAVLNFPESLHHH